VLIIDDVAVNRTVIAEWLNRLGFETIEAASGLEGLAKAQSERPALIITDIVMPGMDGSSHAAVASDAGLRRSAIIAVTASPSGRDEKKSRAAGVNAVSPKPVEFDRLLAWIAGVA